MSRIRQWFNTIDALFDRQALDDPQTVTRAGDSAGTPLTAADAFALCRPVSLQLDGEAQLKRMVSPDGAIRGDGTASRWEFFFDLPSRRAKLCCEWSLLWDEDADEFRQVQIKLVVTPFPPPESTVRQMVKDGKLLRRQMVGLWREEMSRSAPLPAAFRDSPAAMEDARAEGLDPDDSEVTLFASCDPGQPPAWTVQTPDRVFRTALR